VFENSGKVKGKGNKEKESFCSKPVLRTSPHGKVLRRQDLAGGTIRKFCERKFPNGCEGVGGKGRVWVLFISKGYVG